MINLLKKNTNPSKIVTKVYLDKKDMSKKLRQGYSLYEICLGEEMFNKDFDVITEYANIIEDYLPDVIAIHTPVDYNLKYLKRNSIDISDISWNDFAQDVFEKTCFLANLLSKYYKHTIYVITHCNTSFALAKKNGDAAQSLKYMSGILKAYNNINFLIENTIPVETIEGSQNIILKNGFLDDAVLWAQHYNDILLNGNKKFFPLLNIYHAIISTRYCAVMDIYNAPNIEDYVNLFEESPYIYFANAKDLGVEKEINKDFNKDKDFGIYLLNLIHQNFKSPYLCIDTQANGNFVKEYFKNN